MVTQTYVNARMLVIRHRDLKCEKNSDEIGWPTKKEQAPLPKWGF